MYYLWPFLCVCNDNKIMLVFIVVIWLSEAPLEVPIKRHFSKSRGFLTQWGENSFWMSNLEFIHLLKFIYSEKATKFSEIFTLLLSYVVPVKSKVKISENFVAFSEYMNFITFIWLYCNNSLKNVFSIELLFFLRLSTF